MYMCCCCCCCCVRRCHKGDVIISTIIFVIISIVLHVHTTAIRTIAVTVIPTAIFTILITVGLLLLASLKFYKDNQLIAVYYILGLLVIPLILLTIQTIKAKTSTHFKTASLLLKFVMLFGIAFTFILKN